MSAHPNNLQQRRNCHLTAEEEYREKSINTNENKGQTCIKEILAPINAHLDNMLNKHNKVMATRFDSRTPQGAQDLTNKQVGRIFENMKRTLERKEYAGGHKPDPRFIGIQENQG